MGALSPPKNGFCTDLPRSHKIHKILRFYYEIPPGYKRVQRYALDGCPKSACQNLRIRVLVDPFENPWIGISSAMLYVEPTSLNAHAGEGT